MSEFLKNKNYVEGVSKQDCERKAFTRLAQWIKSMRGQMALNMNTARKEYFGKQFMWHIVGKVGKIGIAGVQVRLRKKVPGIAGFRLFHFPAGIFLNAALEWEDTVG